MAKLAIYRGETLEREVDLGPGNARIGRGDQNDIVLPDPGKSVSRFHAELRFESGRYTVVDLNSQNGTWVAGERVQQVVLEPGVPVVVGTYRLVFVGDAAPPADANRTIFATAAPAPAPSAPPAAAARPAAAPAPVAPKPAAASGPAVPAPVVATPPPPVKAEVPPPLLAKKEEQPKAPVAPPPPPEAPKSPAKVVPPAAAAAKPPTPAPVPKPAPPSPAPAAPNAAQAVKAPVAARATPPKAAGKRGSKMVVLGGFAVLVLAAAAAGLFLWPSAAPAPSSNASPVANAPVSTGPSSAEAPAAGALTEPPAQVAQPAPAAAAPQSPALKTPESRVPAAQRAAKVAAAPVGTPRARKDEGAATPRRVPEAKTRPLNLSQTLEQARSAMIKGDYLAAIAGFESILRVDPKYPEAADLLGVARGGARNAAQLAVDSGNKAEMGGDYAGAAKQYERAQQLDADSTAPADAMKRLRARMQGDGEEAFKRAKQFDALGRSSDAIGMYEKALQLLPADHASAKTAKERLAALRGGN